MDPVLIVGAGMAGLACATQLHRAGRSFILIEASGRVGGRVRTDRTADGFLLDHGFQVLLSAYPEVGRQLDLVALAPNAFRSGARIRSEDGGEIFLRDPFQDWRAIPSALKAPIGSLGDKIRMARLTCDVLLSFSSELFAGKAGSTMAYLQEQGFSQRCIELFFAPFFGGVFLDRSLLVDRRFFKFVFRQFVLGRALLPKNGMEAVPQQLAALLPSGSVRLSTVATEVRKNTVCLQDGARLSGSAVVVASEAGAAAKLLPGLDLSKEWKQTTCLYFAAPNLPGRGDGYIRLNAARKGLVHNVCFPSDVSPSYAPSGQTLVSVSVHGNHGLSEASLLHGVRADLLAWFGPQVQDWRHLRSYVIPFALPVCGIQAASARTHDGVYVCGDYLAYPSLNAAMATGRLTAEEILALER